MLTLFINSVIVGFGGAIGAAVVVFVFILFISRILNQKLPVKK